MERYDFKSIESKWQKTWDEEKTYKTKDDHTMPKFYGLIEFPYPSGQGLHVGHPFIHCYGYNFQIQENERQ